MMNRILTFSLFIWLLFVQATIHPYYVSTLEIDHRPEREALQITMRVFTDDWQLVLNTHYDKTLRLDPDTDTEQVVIHSIDYLQQHLGLNLNGTDVTPSVLGKGVPRRSVGSVFGGSGRGRTPNPSGVQPYSLCGTGRPTKYRTNQNPNKTKKLFANPRTGAGCVSWFIVVATLVSQRLNVIQQLNIPMSYIKLP
jgi:hypothetical protein